MTSLLKSITLCGFMGSGKTTVGRLLAEILDCPFTDTDSFIQQRSNLTVSRIFASYGEEYFRDLELEAVLELSRCPVPQIISLGGGMVMKQRVREIVREFSTVVFLDVPIDEIYSRLDGDTSRPLLASPDKINVMTKLFNTRLPIYHTAAHIVVDGSRSPSEICSEIIGLL